MCHATPAYNGPSNQADTTAFQTALNAARASLQDVIGLWLASDTGHCNAGMDGGFTQFGIARISGSASDDYGSYWVMVLGKPG